MGYTVDIDTGGTFTDGLFTDGKEIKRVKVDTTPHDLTVSWIKCMNEGARKFGFSNLEALLEQVDIVRWSNTVASNVIVEGKGPKLGLFVTDGYEKTLYSSLPQSPAFGRLLEEVNVEAVKLPLDKDALLIQVKQLLEKGVRRICISLKDGLKDIENEIRIKQTFEDQYPDHYLGNVPLLLGGDICKHPDDMTRTHMSLLNSYVHGPMAQAMFKAEDEIRGHGYTKPLLLGHTDGGVARVSKTKPVDTIESGPIFGIHAGSYWANLYQIPNVITLDIGGTTSKIGLVKDFRPAVTRNADILGVPLKQTMLDLTSIALGGGTVARVTDRTLHLGPQSMGAYPGPACYDLGGTEATITDAYLIQGFLNPRYFAGGTKQLNLERAEKIVQEKVANPLGIGVKLAAYQITTVATQMVADKVLELINRTRKSPEDYHLFAFGGNGSMMGYDVARKIGIGDVHVFSLGSVLSAFGSSVADISHTYEYSPFLKATEGESLANIALWMVDEARRDMEGEGFDIGKVEAELELFLYDKKDLESLFQITFPWVVCNAAPKNMKDMISDSIKQSKLGSKASDLFVELLRLRVKTSAAKMLPSESPSSGKDPGPAFKEEREIWRGTEKVATKIYDWDKLQTGNTIAGPAIIEGSDTTYTVPRGWQFVMDSFQNGVLTRRR